MAFGVGWRGVVLCEACEVHSVAGFDFAWVGVCRTDFAIGGFLRSGVRLWERGGEGWGFWHGLDGVEQEILPFERCHLLTHTLAG